MTITESPSPNVTQVCPVCGTNSKRHISTGEYWIRECDTCSHQFLESPVSPGHVEDVYADDYFFGGGAGYQNYLAERDSLIEMGRSYGKILRHYHERGSLLDVGSAAGFILEGLAQEGWDGEGLEPNQAVVDYANEMFPSLSHRGTLETFESEEGFDAITMIQVVPHFYDLDAALRAAERLTNPGGIWLVELWDSNSLTAKVLGKNWHEYNPPSVLNWFTESSIRRLAERYGMHMVGRGKPRKRICGSHLKSAIRHNFSEGVVGAIASTLTRIVPDQVVVPYPGDDVFWVAFQKKG